jgi:acetoin utilization protein AcuB
MLVVDWMSKPAITVDINDSMENAIKLLKDHQINMLPVLKRRRLAGVLTKQNLNKWPTLYTSVDGNHKNHSLLSRVKVNEIMVKDPISVPSNYTVDETAMVLLKHKISGATVLNDEDNVVGVITQTDVFRVITSLTGAGRGGIQFGFEVEDQPGSVKILTDTIRNYGGRMASILTSYAMAPKGYRRVYVRMYGIDRFKLNRLKKELREKTTMLYMVDRREVRRETY